MHHNGATPISYTTALLHLICTINSVTDPGFPVGGANPLEAGRRHPTWALFGGNVCGNERTRGGGVAAGAPWIRQ